MSDPASVPPVRQISAPESLETAQASAPGASHQQWEGRTSPKGRVKRVVEKTVDKLGRSASEKTSSKTSQPGSGRLRLFSLNRKASGNDKSSNNIEGDMDARSEPSRTPTRSISPKSPVSSAIPNDDSPFIRPRSPVPAVTRPSLQSFCGNGSMRAGTQTLIQALQAIPWTDFPDHEEDVIHPDLESDSEEDEQRLASSIHTIYRPLARSRRTDTGLGLEGSTQHYIISEEDMDHDNHVVSDEEPEDFEHSTSPSTQVQTKPVQQPELPTSTAQGSSVSTAPSRPLPSRSGTMATVRIQRRAQLADKLRDVFELDGIEEVWAEMPCWILRSVLLQGYMYLTNSYMCFFAHMPARENQVLKSGSLNKKAQRTKRWIKHWFVLKNDALSWYNSSSDPYFPHGIIDLRYAISCDPLNEKEIHLRTNQKSITICADSVPSREEWVKAIRKVIFKAQNMGDSVKIGIPYSAILDVDRSSAMDFSETIEVKVLDKQEHFSVDSYFFAYFQDLPAALKQIRDAICAYNDLPGKTSPQLVLDTTMRLSHPVVERAYSMPTPEPLPKSASGSRFSSFFRPFQDTISLGRTATPHQGSDGEEFTHVWRRGNIATTNSPKAYSDQLPSLESQHLRAGSAKTLTPTSSKHDHTYPPSVESPRSGTGHHYSWSSGVPAWLKGQSRKVLGNAVGSHDSDIGRATSLPTNPNGVVEVYSSNISRTGQPNPVVDLGFSVLETPDTLIDHEIKEKFRTAFAFDDKELLLGYFPGYIFRLLPVFGRLYISANYLCFRSTSPLTSKTRMIMPIRDILATEKSKGTRFGHLGLVVIVKGHEELFFEFSADDRRNSFVALLERQIEEVKNQLAAGSPPPSRGKRDALILEEFEATTPSSNDSDPRPALDNMADSLPAVMFTSSSSTFLTFKPKDPMHFTFLTIGSRGDVQPYIALAKGLLADGHRVKIATHGEFKEWIESHGIEYGFVGGDPAELMRICVENGVFTVSFLKEGVQKFRGWLDDLLKTSWEACQDTDVLVESPSAMGGYHIAEALGIPYFRAFTMTWTRTRAYPHAFAVPDHKMGGGYNYMSYVMFDQVFWRATAGQINRWRRDLLHLDSTGLDKMEPHKIPFLYNFSPMVVPPPLDWPEWIRVTGYWFLDDADVSSKKWTPPSDLVDFIGHAHSQGKKVVYIGFGSIVVSDPKKMTKCVIQAVVRSGVYAILSKGWSDRLHVKTSDASEPEEPLPPQVYSISSIPHDWLFQRIDAACHHGGAGTTGASLRAGIPTIIHPFFGDQFFWADRVEALGVGSGVRKLTADALADALVAATTDIKQIDRAKIIGQQIRAEDGVATAIESIYRDLEYARSLVKRPPSDDDTDNGMNGESTSSPDHKKKLKSRSTGGSGYSSSGSVRGAPSEDWSVISDQDEPRQDERRPSLTPHHNDGKDHSLAKRHSLAAAVMSVLPDSLSPSRRRSVSPNPRS